MYLGMIVEQGDAATLFSRPHHPYSSGLLSSVLLPHRKLTMESNVSLKDEIPSPIDLPPGCFLASRPFVIDRCRGEMPPAELVEPGHSVHCFRHADATNLRSVFLYTRAVRPGMIERKFGRIISTCSQPAHKGAAEMAHYAAAKVGVIGFTRSLA